MVHPRDYESWPSWKRAALNGLRSAWRSMNADECTRACISCARTRRRPRIVTSVTIIAGANGRLAVCARPRGTSLPNCLENCDKSTRDMLQLTKVMSLIPMSGALI